jgi:dipeptidyl aminopeptidase/acylaminoacyl peptidase
MGKDFLPLDVLLKVPCVDSYEGFDLSPDGKTVAFSWNSTGQWEIYLLPIGGSSPPRQITSGKGAKFAPTWSPDGRRLAYVLDPEGGECFDIYTYHLVTKEFLNLTPDTAEAIHPSLSWSPDGNWIGFASNRAGSFDSYIIPSNGGEAKKVLARPEPDWKVVWSPNGKWIAVVMEAIGQDYHTMLIPFPEGEPFPVSEEGQVISSRDIAWSPDGNQLAFTSDHYGRYDVGIFNVESHSVSWLTDSDGDRESPTWSPDGNKVAYISSWGPTTALEIHNLYNSSVIKYQYGRGVHYHPLFTPDGNRLLFTFNTPQHPDDLMSLRLSDGRYQQLTRSLPRWISRDALVTPLEVTYPSMDKENVPALLYLPASDGVVHPAVIYVHGGPNWLTQITWDPLIQHMVSRGWVVLAPNYRGSTCYGREWQLANQFDLGGRDTQDIVAGADYLVQAGFADSKKIAVTGRSYGGYLTMTGLTQYPDRWAGGSAVVPFLNWFTSSTAAREDLVHWDRENMGDLEEQHDLYYERSPFFFLDRVQAPVQLICGAHDPRCPASESILARDRLKELGKQVDFILYEDEGHSFLKTENVIKSKLHQVEFLANVLEK